MTSLTASSMGSQRLASRFSNHRWGFWVLGSRFQVLGWLRFQVSVFRFQDTASTSAPFFLTPDTRHLVTYIGFWDKIDPFLPWGYRWPKCRPNWPKYGQIGWLSTSNLNAKILIKTRNIRMIRYSRDFLRPMARNLFAYPYHGDTNRPYPFRIRNRCSYCGPSIGRRSRRTEENL